MPAVMEPPELLEQVETHDLIIERHKARRARPGFWRTLAHGITTYLTPTPYERHAPGSFARRPFESPMDRLARENPFLAAYALAII
jgi:hypothetical protein